MNGKKKVLFPLIENPDEVNCTTMKIFMVNGKQFEKEMKRNQVCFAIIPKGLSFGSNDRVTTEASNDKVAVETGRS